ncbi:hypothetical protein CFBP5507_05900 [Agrobacterium salinitolerans]|uniref:Uncharacterized protein n=1 Tax=Agrobacterium salinitolerans TaxID=1183413 RepID=A0A4Z1QVY8_9HYPH|nr:hypothetical protein [Agrobacterium salinitolerans]UYZ08532.1 hypothetical protein CFBP5507_05900 [Agrobacterium salinitolerans]
MLKPVAILVIASLLASGQAVAEPSDDEIMSMTALKWAGMNCGKMISDSDYQAALDYTNKLDPEKSAFAMRRLKAMVSKASNRDVACKSIIDAMTDG